MLSRWQGGLGALIVTLVACELVILDLADHGLRRWQAEHALTTGTVPGLLVLLITVLVADQVLKLRQINDRARAVAAQDAIVTGQAIRSAQAVFQVLAGAGDRDAAGDEFRTYMMMLLVAAPVLIDARTSLAFLEQAQALGGELVRALAAARPGGQGGYPPARLDDAVRQLKDASAPLLQALARETLLAVRGDQPD
ncbi:MAG TPA: hypothetical protein VFX25_37095 [Streptosporangiaceae bacterium]|nr:hypothetical protein [Streptosporangiaceae bacterium]